LKGPDCPECMQLAEAASHAVDFPKTGTPANFTGLPRPPSQERPDFLAPETVDSVDNNRYYPSEKLLGILFRNVPAAERPELRNDASNTPSDGNCIFNALSEINLSELGLPPFQLPQDDLWEEMLQLLEAYSEHLLSIAQVYTVSKSKNARVSEAELISGTITGKWSDHRKRREAVIAMNLQVSIIIFISSSPLLNFSSDPRTLYFNSARDTKSELPGLRL
jgi:RNA-dependent RNA polymerase